MCGPSYYSLINLLGAKGGIGMSYPDYEPIK